MPDHRDNLQEAIAKYLHKDWAVRVVGLRRLGELCIADFFLNNIHGVAQEIAETKGVLATVRNLTASRCIDDMKEGYYLLRNLIECGAKLDPELIQLAETTKVTIQKKELALTQKQAGPKLTSPAQLAVVPPKKTASSPAKKPNRPLRLAAAAP